MKSVFPRLSDLSQRKQHSRLDGWPCSVWGERYERLCGVTFSEEGRKPPQVAPFKATCGNPELRALENTTCDYYTVRTVANPKPLAFRYKTLGLTHIDPI